MSRTSAAAGLIVAALFGTALGAAPPAGPAAKAAPAKDDFPGFARPLQPNAALAYWQAFDAMPKHKPEQLERMRDVAAVTVDDDLRKLVDGWKTSLDHLHRASRVGPCEWGLDYEAGLEMLLPHLGHGRTLGFAALVRAKVRAVDGDAAGAAEDVTAVLRLSRHLGSDPVLISMLVGAAVENAALETAASMLPVLAGTGLPADVAKLPPLVTTAECVMMEGRIIGRMAAQLRKLRDEQGRDAAHQRIRRFVGLGAGDMEPFPLSDVDGFAAMMDAVPEFYRQYVEITRLPRDQYDIALQNFETAVKKNAVARLCTPALSSIRRMEDRLAVRRTMFGVALRIVKGGKAAAEGMRDPVAGEPLTVEDLPGGGWEIRSTVKDVTPLKVGTWPAKPAPAEKK